MSERPALRDVLEAHARYEAEGLPGVLGDGYLCAHVAMFRNARRLALAAGFRFSDRPPFPYAEQPLLCLERIWRHRCIPFVANVPALQAVEELRPGRMEFGEVAQLGLRQSTAFHESVHCIVRSILQQKRETGGSRRNTRSQLLERLLEESCANAGDALGMASAQTTLTKLFADVNFYTIHGAARVALERIGLRHSIELLAVAYLYSNFLYERLSARQITDIAAEVLPAEALRELGERDLVRLFRRALAFSPSFRVVTTGVTLKLAGFDEPVFDLLDFDFSAQIRRGTRLRRALAVFASSMACVEALAGQLGRASTSCSRA